MRVIIAFTLFFSHLLSSGAQYQWKISESWVNSLISSGPSSAVDVIAAGLLPNVGTVTTSAESDNFPTKENVTQLANEMRNFFENSLDWAKRKHNALQNVTNRIKFLSIACQSAHREFILSYLPHTLRSMSENNDQSNFFKNWSKTNVEFVKTIDTFFEADLSDASPGDSTLHRIRHLFVVSGSHFSIGNYEVWFTLYDLSNQANRKVLQLLQDIEANKTILLSNGDPFCGLKGRLSEIYGEFFRLYTMITSYADAVRSYTLPLFDQFDSLVGSVQTIYSLQEANNKIQDLRNRLDVSIKPEILAIASHRRQKFGQLKNDGFDHYLSKYFSELMVS